MEKSASESSIFKMPQGAFMGYLAFKHAVIAAIIAGIAVLALAGIGVASTDLRFIILSLMALFILIPMGAAMLYINYALNPEIAFNTLPHSLKLTQEGVIVEIFEVCKASRLEEEEPEANELSEDALNNDGNAVAGKRKNEGPDISYSPVATKIIPYNRIGKYDVINGGVCVSIHRRNQSLEESEKGNSKLDKTARGFIYIPMKAFERKENFEDFLKTIYNNQTPFLSKESSAK